MSRSPKFEPGQVVAWDAIPHTAMEAGSGVIAKVEPSRLTGWFYTVEVGPCRRFVYYLGEPDLRSA